MMMMMMKWQMGHNYFFQFWAWSERPVRLNSTQSQSFRTCSELCDWRFFLVFLSRKSDHSASGAIITLTIRINSTASWVELVWVESDRALWSRLYPLPVPTGGPVLFYSTSRCYSVCDLSVLLCWANSYGFWLLSLSVTEIVFCLVKTKPYFVHRAYYTTTKTFYLICSRKWNLGATEGLL